MNSGITNATILEVHRVGDNLYVFYQNSLNNRCQISEWREQDYNLIAEHILLGGNLCKKISFSETYFSVEFETEIWIYDVDLSSGLVVIDTLPLRSPIVDMKIGKEYLFYTTST